MIFIQPQLQAESVKVVWGEGDEETSTLKYLFDPVV